MSHPQAIKSSNLAQFNTATPVLPFEQALLDPQELPVETATDAADLEGIKPSPTEAFRHSGWKIARKRVYDALKRTHQSVTRIAAFGGCGENGWIMRSVANPLVYRFATNSCHDRLCVPCARDRAHVITSNVAKLLAGQPCRFVTLTLRRGEVDLDFGIRRLLQCFRRLRQRAFWRSRVKGGVFFIEFKWSANSQAWHVHLHVICHGRYIPQEDLKRHWYDVTGDSFIVDVKFVRDDDKVARYVAKYVTKPYDRDDNHTADRMDEIVDATHRKRLIGGFGDWSAVTLTERPEDGEWTIVGDVVTLVYAARNGDADAAFAIEQALRTRYERLDVAVPAQPQQRGPPHLQAALQSYFSWPVIDARF